MRATPWSPFGNKLNLSGTRRRGVTAFGSHLGLQRCLLLGGHFASVDEHIFSGLPTLGGRDIDDLVRAGGRIFHVPGLSLSVNQVGATTLPAVVECPPDRAV